MGDTVRPIERHRRALVRCRRCPEMCSTPVAGEPVESKILLVGQAPGAREPQIGKPFAWTAGKKLFSWFEAAGVSEPAARNGIYFAAVCRCFPGKAGSGGDRSPNPQEIENCSTWLGAEIALLRPRLIIAVGKLAIMQFIPCDSLSSVVGKFHRSERARGAEILPLPHPSGASPWTYTEPGRVLLRTALNLLEGHPAWRKLAAAEMRCGSVQRVRS